MESSNGDELTPNQLINRIYDEVQQNPFEENFRDALRPDRSSPQPISQSLEPDPLDTPQVVSNTVRDNFHNSFPMTEDDDDETLFMSPPNLDSPCRIESEVGRSESPGTEIIGVCTRRESDLTNVDNKNSAKKERINDKIISPEIIKRNENQVYSTFSSELPRISVEESLNKLVVLNFLPLTNKQKVPVGRKCTNLQILKSANLTSNSIQSSQISSTQLSNYNVSSIPTKVIKPLPHPESTKGEPTSAIKQKLKNLLNPSSANVVRIEHVIDNPGPPPPILSTLASQEIDKRERNRMAQKRSRMKKKTLQTQLTTKLESIRDENKSLRLENTYLRKEVARLKKLLLDHKNCPLIRVKSKTDISEITIKDVQPTTTTVNGNHRSPCDGKIQPLMRSIAKNANQNNRLIIEAKNNIIQLSSNNKNANSNDNFNKKPPLRVIINKCSQSGTESETNDAQSTVPKRIIQLNENGTPEITELNSS